MGIFDLGLQTSMNEKASEMIDELDSLTQQTIYSSKPDY